MYPLTIRYCPARARGPKATSSDRLPKEVSLQDNTQGIKVNPKANTFICESVARGLSVREDILSKNPSNANRSADAKATKAGRRMPEPPLENAPPEIMLFKSMSSCMAGFLAGKFRNLL